MMVSFKIHESFKGQFLTELLVSFKASSQPRNKSHKQLQVEPLSTLPPT